MLFPAAGLGAGLPVSHSPSLWAWVYNGRLALDFRRQPACVSCGARRLSQDRFYEPAPALRAGPRPGSLGHEPGNDPAGGGLGKPQAQGLGAGS